LKKFSNIAYTEKQILNDFGFNDETSVITDVHYDKDYNQVVVRVCSFEGQDSFSESRRIFIKDTK